MSEIAGYFGCGAVSHSPKGSASIARSRAQAFGAALRELREERQLSQEGAALKCGIDRVYFGQLERAATASALKKIG